MKKLIVDWQNLYVNMVVCAKSFHYYWYLLPGGIKRLVCYHFQKCMELFTEHMLIFGKHCCKAYIYLEKILTAVILYSFLLLTDFQ